MEQVVAAFKAHGGTNVKLNTVDHGTFQDQISSYLQGTPDTSSLVQRPPHALLRRPGLATSLNDTGTR